MLCTPTELYVEKKPQVQIQTPKFGGKNKLNSILSVVQLNLSILATFFFVWF